jgi:hypothetical protein
MLAEACSAAVPASEYTISTGRLYKVASLDVAGVRLGMSPEMVQQELTRAGYALSAQGRTSDFAARVQRRAMERRGEPVDNLIHKGQLKLSTDVGNQTYQTSSSQQVSIQFTATPSGMKVSEVSYQVELDYLDQSTFLDTIERKYGRPSQIYYYDRSPQAYIYCDVLDPKCGPDRPQLTAVVVTPYGFNKKSRTLVLQQGRIAENANLAAVEAAVNKAEPKVSTPQF